MLISCNFFVDKH